MDTLEARDSDTKEINLPADESRPRTGEKQFDSTGKLLIELGPDDWIKLARLPGEVVAFENVNKVAEQIDLDRLLRVERANGSSYFAHFEFQGTYDRRDERRFWRYNVIATEQNDAPVRTVIVLLRRKASRQGKWSGILNLPGYSGEIEHFWSYDVIKVWELDPEVLMTAGLGTLPLAPLAKVPKAKVPALLTRIKNRLEQEDEGRVANDLWGLTNIFLGLRFQRDEINQMMDVMLDPIFRESSTIQIVLERGREEGRLIGEEHGRLIGEEHGRLIGEEHGRLIGEEQGRLIGEEQGAIRLRESLLQLGRVRFGEPTPHLRESIEDTHDLNRLSNWLNRLLEADSWQSLLQD